MDAQYEGAIPHRTYFAVTSLGYIVVLLAMTAMVFLGAARRRGPSCCSSRGSPTDSTLYQTGYVLATLLPCSALLLDGRRRSAGQAAVLGRRARAALAPWAWSDRCSCSPACRCRGTPTSRSGPSFPQELEKNWQDAERWYIAVSSPTPQSHRHCSACGLFGIGAVLIGGAPASRAPAAELGGVGAGWRAVVAGIAAWLLHAAGVDAATTFSLISMALTVPFALGIFLVSQQGIDDADDASRAPAGRPGEATTGPGPRRPASGGRPSRACSRRL